METKSTLTYRCPNCSAGLVFQPEKGKLCCEFCQSEFTEAEVLAAEAERAAEDAASAAAEQAAAESERPDEAFCAQMAEYHCASCGAEILCDENTAATECPYCHNPILLAGRLSGQMRPHKIIPFKFSKEQAEEKFLEFAGRKKFVPSDFVAPRQVEKIAGVYYPFWVTDADTSASMTARATRKRSWRAGDYLYTETSNFRVHRAGDIHFEDIVTPAITEEDREMLDGILPYPSDSLEPFAAPRLQGFLAKKRNLESAEVREAVKARMIRYTATLLRDTIHGYTTVTPNAPRMLIRNIHWDYTLMPIWLLTYQRKGKTYMYAMNGYTGKVYGQLPVSGKKLAILAAIVGAAVAFLIALTGFLAF